MGPGLKALSQSWNIGSNSSVPGVVDVETVPSWRLLFSALNRSVPSFFSTVNVEVLLRDGAKSFQAKRGVFISVPTTGSNLMEKKNPLKKVIPHPAIGN
jgi:hypothetical protein